MEVSVRQAAQKHGVNYDTLYRAIRDEKRQPAFSAHQVVVPYQPRQIWVFDDESEGFREWISRYKPRKNESSERPEISPQTS